MDNVAILLLAVDFFALISSIALIRLSGTRLVSLAPVTVFFYLYMVYTLFVHFLILFYTTGLLKFELLELLVIANENHFKSNLLSFGFLLLFSLGVFLSSVLFKLSDRASEAYRSPELPIMPLIKNLPLFSLLLAMVILMDLGMLALFFKSYGVPMFSDDVDNARYLMIEGGGFKYLFPVFMYTNPFVAALLFSFALTGQKGKLYLYPLLLLSVAVQFLSSLVGFRTFIIVYFIILTSVYMLYKRPTVRKLVMLFFATILAITALTYLKYSSVASDEPLVLLYKIFHRLIFDGYYSQGHIFTIFENQDYLYGLSYWWDLYSKLPGQQMSFQNFLSIELGDTEYFMALAPTLPGELFANFGWFALFFAFILGFATNLISFKLKKYLYSRGSFFSFIGYVLMIMFLLRSIEVGIGGVYFLVIVVLIIFSVLRAVHAVILGSVSSGQPAAADDGTGAIQR